MRSRLAARAAAIGSLPRSDLPSERSTTAEGGRRAPPLTALRSVRAAARIASPLAVPPLALMLSIAAWTAAWSRVGLWSTVAVWLNARTPIPIRAGTPRTNRWAASLAAASRLGLTSVAVIDPDTSVASITEACSTGTATVRCGLAAATTSLADAVGGPTGHRPHHARARRAGGRGGRGLHTEVGPLDRAPLLEYRHHCARRVRRHGEADPDIASGSRRLYLGVHPHDVSGLVEQRA